MDPPHLQQRRARYMPKRRENLHPAMLAMIGRVFEWSYAGDDRWMLDSKHNADIPPGAIGVWAAEADLEPVLKQVKT
jgi:hypothetical protein